MGANIIVPSELAYSLFGTLKPNPKSIPVGFLRPLSF